MIGFSIERLAKKSFQILDEPLTTWKKYVSEAPAFAELK